MKPATTIVKTPTHQIEPELAINMMPRSRDDWTGTAQQLIDEGLIPAKGFKWPAPGDSAEWSDRTFRYRLERIKPEGLKLPRGKKFTGDNWRLLRDLISEHLTGHARAEIYAHEVALQKVRARHTAKGRALSERCVAARLDDDFTAFKAALGLTAG